MSDIYSFLTKDLYITGSVTSNPDGTSTTTATTASSDASTYGETASETIVSGEIDGNLSFIGGFIQSKNFVSGTSGWRLSANGTLEAVNATLSGSINATSGTIGGTTITSTALTGGIIQTATSGNRIVIDSTPGIFGFNSSNQIGMMVPTIGVFGVVARGWQIRSSDNGYYGSFVDVRTDGHSTTGTNWAGLYAPNASDSNPDPNNWTDRRFQVQYIPSSPGDYTQVIMGSNTKFNSDLDCIVDENNDIGSSSLKWDNVWTRVLHYVTLSVISDQNTKENITTMTRGGLSHLKALQTKKYERKDNPGVIEYGLIAQEVQAVMPELVTEEKIYAADEKTVIGTQLGINQSMLITMLVKSVQELTAKVEKLEKKT